MKSSIVYVAAGLCALAGTLSQPAIARAQDVALIRCEAEGHSDDYCQIDTRGGVRLVRQTSGAPCIQNKSWGFDDNGIWVKNGCGAEFEVTETERGHGHRRDRDEQRNADRRDEDQRDENQDEDRDEGQSEDRNQDSEEHDEDRQDDERDNSRERHHDRDGQRSHGPAVSISCESHDYGYQYCSVHVRRSVELVRQVSASACVSNESWGYDRDGVWVDKGCKAEFVVH